MKKFYTTLVIALFSITCISQTAYIPNFSTNTVSVIDLTTNTVTDTISVGASPFGVCVSPDGTKVYVSNQNDNTVSVINTANNTVLSTIPVGVSPEGLCISADGSKVYVANNSFSTINVINTFTNMVSNTIPLPITFLPFGITISPDGSKVYVGSISPTGGLIEVNTLTLTASVSIINQGTNSMCIATSPDGSKMYATESSGNTVSVINTVNNTVPASITVGNQPTGVCVSPNGRKVYVCNTTNTVSVIDAVTNSVATTIPAGVQPKGISVTPDGSKIYIANHGNGTVSEIDTVTNTVSATITVGGTPGVIGNFISVFSKHCFAHYITSYDSTLNMFTLNLDSITSALATSYHWDFGDGTTSTLAYPTHAYAIDSLYNVCLKIYTSTGDSCEYCHIIGIDSLGNVQRTGGFTINVFNPTTVGIKDISNESSISISPNPFTSQTTITFSEDEPHSLKLTDLLGKDLKTWHITGKELKLERGDLKSGIYFLQITDEKNKVTNKKIVIE